MIWVRCARCRRVRFHSPNAGVWQKHDEPMPGEVSVICRDCLVAVLIEQAGPATVRASA